ncbi:MAG TPA: ABC transporter permease [Bacillota bacterium]|nr:ABC transporter permease [Bacillota bacterium]HQE67287.1 ABC transporter permease [Bacillota bacterium]HQI16034.1 ABC transporter permease [Bacillota bacterium]HQJ36480.1 ABC transporter permease [Bacillota bacterium]
MNIAESFISALQSIKANKMRSFLTMLGIIIGISSVITIVSIGQGGKEAIMGEFDDLGTNVINVSVKSLDNEIEERDYLTLKDAQLIKDKIPEVTAVVPAAGTMGYMKTDKEKKFAEIDCITHEFNKLMKVEILAGRFLSEGDIEAARNVIVIDEITANKLFKGPKDAVGQRIKVTINDNNTNFTIIGVSETTGGSMAAMFGDNYPGLGYVPITLRERIMPKVQISWFSVLLESMDNSKEVATKIVRLLEQSHRNKGKYAAEEGFKELDMLNNVLNIFTMVIGAIAGISLVVGGIGVMNIMLVSVTERTREIGIRKALGAKNKDIMLQFLTESIILCLIGGTIGMSLGITLGLVAGKIINIPLGVSPLVILLAFTFSSAVGIFFGLYPANKAAKLDPIEALRYE